MRDVRRRAQRLRRGAPARARRRVGRRGRSSPRLTAQPRSEVGSSRRRQRSVTLALSRSAALTAATLAPRLVGELDVGRDPAVRGRGVGAGEVGERRERTLGEERGRRRRRQLQRGGREIGEDARLAEALEHLLPCINSPIRLSKCIRSAWLKPPPCVINRTTVSLVLRTLSPVHAR